MGRLQRKYVGLIACVVAIICTILVAVGIFVKANKANDKNEVAIMYEDDYYCNADVLDVNNKIVQDIYENYENGGLELAVSDNNVTYKVNQDDIKKINEVSSSLCMNADDSDESVLLYLGDKVDCKYNAETGEAVSEFDNKWLLLNNTIPLAMYNEKIDGNVKEYFTPAYINDDQEASNILIKIDESNAVTVVGKVITKDIEGNELEKIQIEELKDRDKICPAYVNYYYSIVNIANSVVRANEVYNATTYTFGSDYQLSYSALPDNFYLYSMRANYKDDTVTKENETDYGYYTEQKQISIVNEDVVEINEVTEDKEDGGEYDYMGVFEFLKKVWKHKKVTSAQEVYQTFEHKIDGVEKGYISTWNSLTINKALRTDNFESLDEDDKLTTNTLNNMCKKISAEENCTMLRKVSASYLTSVFGVESKDGKALSDEMIKNYSDADKKELENRMQSIVGKKMVEKGFMSASIIPYVNIIFGRTVEIVIKVPKGSKYYITHNVVESEAIFPLNTELTVETVKYNAKKGKYVITAMLSQNL